MTCPDLEELEEYFSHSPDDPSSRALAGHLVACADCSSRLAEIEENHRMEGPLRALLAERSGRAAQPPAAIGRYRIVRELGRGGMGVVYEAWQQNPERTVALKVVNPAFVSPQALRRFEHESQILGRLQHPGIAQIFEAGTAEISSQLSAFSDQPQVLPFFAMELVRGPTLRDHARQRSLGVREKLELIAKVCDAVEHAHQKGVIHRDLKPSNILIAEDKFSRDSKRSAIAALGTRSSDESRLNLAQPKILDFGVARVTDSDWQMTTLHTNAAQLLGTVPYMSPEQVSGNPNDLDTRSDVYALGVMTYELLAGRLPYEVRERSLPEALRAIREQDPTPLSSIDRQFRGDLETVVARALDKDKTRRYPSAAELAADIRRYLRDEPVLARPPSARYQLSKFARRHRGLVVGTIAVAVALAAGGVVSLQQAIRAWRAERLAQTRLVEAVDARARAEAGEAEARSEAEKSAAVTTFLQDMLEAVSPEKRPGQAEFTVREALDAAAQRTEAGSLAQQPEIEVAVRTTLGNTYRALGDLASAEPQLRAAVELGRRTYPEGHGDLAFAINKLARVLSGLAKHEEAEALFRECLDMRRRLLGPEHPDVATSMNNLAELLRERGNLDEAERLHDEALDMRRKLLGPEHASIASSLNNLALLRQERDDVAGAEALLRESLDMDLRLRGEGHPDVQSTMTNLGMLLADTGRLDEGEVLLRRALALRRASLPGDHPALATTLNNLANVAKGKGEFGEAESLYGESLEMYRRLLGARHPQVATTLNNLGLLMMERGDYAQAEELVRQSLDIRRDVLGEGHADTLGALFSIALVQMRAQRFDDAERTMADAVAKAEAALPLGHWHIGAFLRTRGTCLRELKRFEEAEPCLLRAFKIIHPEGDAPLQPSSRAVSTVRELVALYEAWGQMENADHWRGRLPPE